jgi:hypothetical protein
MKQLIAKTTKCDYIGVCVEANIDVHTFAKGSLTSLARDTAFEAIPKVGRVATPKKLETSSIVLSTTKINPSHLIQAFETTLS